jgi:hypothetical protein
MPLVGIGTLPTPFSPASVPLPPETGGRGHTSQRVFPSPQKQGGGGTLACGWGVGGSPNSRGAYTVVLFICTYFVDSTLCTCGGVGGGGGGGTDA